MRRLPMSSNNRSSAVVMLLAFITGCALNSGGGQAKANPEPKPVVPAALTPQPSPKPVESQSTSAPTPDPAAKRPDSPERPETRKTDPLAPVSPSSASPPPTLPPAIAAEKQAEKPAEKPIEKPAEKPTGLTLPPSALPPILPSVEKAESAEAAGANSNLASAPKQEQPEKRDMILTRVFDAPVKRVWQAWVDPKEVMRWWGPKDYTSPFCTMDVRLGGKYLVAMRAPDGKDYWSTGTFTKISKNKLLEYIDSFSDEKGNVVSANHYGLGDDFPLTMQTQVTFEKHGIEKTKLTLTVYGMPGGPIYDYSILGWNESFEKLAAVLKN